MILRQPFRASFIFSTAGLTTMGLLMYLFCGSAPTSSVLMVRQSSAPELYPESAPAPVYEEEKPSLMAGWPEDPAAERGKLVWPPSGCDAGMWSSTYTYDRVDDSTIRVSSEGKFQTSYEVGVLPGHDVRLYPASPQRMYVVTTSPDEVEYTVAVIEDGQSVCFTVRQPVNTATAVHAQATEDGLQVFTRGDLLLEGRLFNGRCEELASRQVVEFLQQR